MQLCDDPGEAQYRIERYEPDNIHISGQAYHENLIIMPDKLIVPWHVEDFTTLHQSHLSDILTYQPQIVIVGTGHTLLSPRDYSIFSPLMTKKIGFELMDTRAACRTYTILMAEGRKVLAMLFVG